MNKIVYQTIGFVENAFSKRSNPKTVRNSPSYLVLDERYLPAMEGLKNFRYLLVIYHLDRSPGYKEKVHPMGDENIPSRGVLATRSPCRPNPLGTTVVEILGIDGNRIEVTGLDALDGTPILDIKPYEEHFDSPLGIERERDPSYRPKDRFEK